MCTVQVYSLGVRGWKDVDIAAVLTTVMLWLVNGICKDLCSDHVGKVFECWRCRMRHFSPSAEPFQALNNACAL